MKTFNLFILLLFLLCLNPSLSAQDKKESWKALDEKGAQFFNEGNYAEALKIFVKAEAAAKKEFGVSHVTYGEALQSLAVLQLYTGDLEASEKSFMEALRIHVAAAGKNNEQYEGYLNGVVSLYLTMGNQEKAMVYWEESRTVASAVHGKNSDEHLTAIKGLADQYLNTGNVAKAESLLVEGKGLALGKEKWIGDFATRLFQLYAEQEDAKKAEPYFQEAKRIRNKSQQEFWKTVDFKSMTYTYEIDDQDARLAYWKDQVREQKEADPESVSYALALMNLAMLYQTQEEYGKAEPPLMEAKKIIEANGTLANYGTLCTNLAFYYDNVGNEGAAEKYYQEDVTAVRTAEGRDHINYGTACSNQSIFDIGHTNQKRGELLVKTALLVFAGLNEGYTYYTSACAGLAILYEKTGDYNLAEAYEMESEKIIRMAFGENHYTYAPVATALGRIYEKQTKIPQAEVQFTKAKVINEKVFGKDHIQYAGYCYELARFYLRQKQYARAAPLFSEAKVIKLDRIQDNFGNLSEKEKKDLYKSGSFYIDNYAFCLLKLYQQDKTVARDLYNLVMATKGLICQSSTKVRAKILASGNSQLIQQFHDWTAKREYLAKTYAMAVEERKKKGVDLPKLEEEANALEKKMIQQATALRISGLEENKGYDWKQVRDKLKPNEAAIEIIRTTRDGIKEESVYGALIVTGKPESEPELVIIGSGQSLETKAIGYYNNTIRFKLDDTASYRKLWKPIANKLAGVNKIYFSPDGLYHQVSLPTLKNPLTRKYLMEEQEIVIVGNTKDLLKDEKVTGNTAATCLVGFPDYKGNDQQQSILPDSTRSVAWADITQAKERYFDLSTGSVTPLPGTRTEVQNIQGLLKSKNMPVSLLMGKEATEAEVKRIKDPKVLHIATHGFFLASQRVTNANGELTVKAMQDPLLRSGLLLAGCEQSLKGESTNAGEEDGILSAYEAMNLFLDDTDLVVLSACETGLGEINNGEGVYGLQRAFQQAGAHFILVSLWKVDDEATQLLMTTFYKMQLEGADYTQAFSKAREAVRARYPEPYYWGAFVLIGV